jgi:hypothetical protein
MSPDAAKSLVSTNPDLANQLANEKQSAALDAALANLKSSSGKAADAIAGYLDKARGEPEFSTTTNFYSPPPTASGIGLSMYGVGQPVNTSPPTSDWDDPANIQARVDAARAATAQYNAQNTPIGPDIDQEIIDMTYGKDSFTNTNIGPPSLAPNEYATTPTYAQGGPVSLGSLYNNVRARRGPITGGQRSGGGIMSLR